MQLELQIFAELAAQQTPIESIEFWVKLPQFMQIPGMKELFWAPEMRHAGTLENISILKIWMHLSCRKKVRVGAWFDELRTLLITYLLTLLLN